MNLQRIIGQFFLSLFLFSLLTSFQLQCAEKFKFDFSQSNAGWMGDFSDYPVGGEAFFDLSWGWTNLAAPFQSGNQTLTKGMFLSGNNHSDDLFMYLKRQVVGLKPNTVYRLIFSVTIENNIPPGQFGIGGSPGESVYFKVGAAKIEPKNIIVNGNYRLNVDKGNQSQSGKNAIVVGNLANPLVHPNNPLFELKKFTNETPLKVRTDCKGRLWLFIGTDSGFEGPSFYYIAKINIIAKP